MPDAAVVVLSERSASKAEKHAPDLTQPYVAPVARRLRCGRCGCTMRQRVTSARTGPPRRYYACTSGDRGRPCGARWWRKEALEAVLREEDSERAGGVGGEEAGLKGTPPSELEAVLERLDGLGAQLAKVEQTLTALAGAGLTMEGVLGAIERLEGPRSKGPQAKKRRGEDEEDGLTALTALVVAGLRALVMLVPELPVTSTIAAKILGIQRVKLDGRGVITRSFGRAQVASISEWMTAAESVFPPHPGVG
ncbi:MAG: recombinase zinc beta ribbon domain-containing protein, partial [Deltaproteobacteria bacterium]|nr:recombinase zinc beta ribbon domain-containing protein [Deltaproteobacteria bacterium]